MEWLNIDIQQWSYIIGGLILVALFSCSWLFSGSLIIGYFLITVLSFPLWMVGMLPFRDGRYPPVVTMGLLIIGIIYVGILIFKQPSVNKQKLGKQNRWKSRNKV